MGKDDRLLNRAIVVMAIAALGTTAFAVRRELAPPPPAPRYDQPQHVKAWKSFRGGGSRIGPADAAVTIIEFSDFQCEFCKVHAERLNRLRQEHPGQIAIIFRHYPVTELHPHAYNAAVAAECAGEQGRFEAYRDVLFRNQARIGKTGWSEFARQAAVPDVGEFGNCVSERRPARRIAADLKAGKKLGVPATPTILINEWKVVGAPDEQKLATLVADALRSARTAALAEQQGAR
jgi:protein-disulfide isomerase